MRPSIALLAAAVVPACIAAHPTVSNDTLAAVRKQMLASISKSWELGTGMEALLQLEAPDLSVFGTGPIPVSSSATVPADVLAILNGALSKRPANASTFVADSAVGDPASLGVADLIAAATAGKKAAAGYQAAADAELNYLLTGAPKQNGTISHRSEYFQAWADFVSMAPPFIAYYGAAEGGSAGKTILQNAYLQCAGYRALLRDPASGLWRHIVDGPWDDTGLWATGNGWAAMGMLRVLQTIQKSTFAKSMTTQTADLTQWVQEIVNGTWARQQPSGAVLNYFDIPGSFEDSSGTALLAAATYRLAVVTESANHIDAANKAMSVVLKRIGTDGWLTGVVDPENFIVPGTHSPEGQAFVLMLAAAARDYWAAVSAASASWSSMLEGAVSRLKPVSGTSSS